MPATIATLGGRLGAWLHSATGLAPASLLPSVRFALECALLGALAASRGTTLAGLLASPSSAPASAPAAAAAAAAAGAAVRVNGLISNSGSLEDLAAEVAAALAQGHRALKIKVGRRVNPALDAQAVLKARELAGPGVALRADANRAWGLDAALEFGRLAKGAGLQYVEEPTQVGGVVVQGWEERCIGLGGWECGWRHTAGWRGGWRGGWARPGVRACAIDPTEPPPPGLPLTRACPTLPAFSAGPGGHACLLAGDRHPGGRRREPGRRRGGALGRGVLGCGFGP